MRKNFLIIIAFIGGYLAGAAIITWLLIFAVNPVLTLLGMGGAWDVAIVFGLPLALAGGQLGGIVAGFVLSSWVSKKIVEENQIASSLDTSPIQPKKTYLRFIVWAFVIFGIIFSIPYLIYYSGKFSCVSRQAGSDKDLCLANLLKREPDNRKYCEEMSTQTSAERCFYDYYFYGQNRSGCDLDPSPIGKEQCYAVLAIASKESPEVKEKYCDQISKQDEQEECYSRYGSTPSSCSKIVSERWKNGCYWSLAFNTKDATWCDKIPQGSIDANSCYNYFASDLGQKNVCSKIINIGRFDRWTGCVDVKYRDK